MSFITDIVTNELANAHIVNAAYHRIIEADCAKNYAGREIDASLVKHGFNVYKSQGGKFFSTETVIILYSEPMDGTVEFHTSNAGSGRDLTKAVTVFLRQVSEHASYAFTCYDNAQISELFQYTPFAVEITRVDEGVDRTFKAVVDLHGGGQWDS